ncbi:MAG: ATP12 family chaperone protein [Bosea sp. (in: a-proteobacteria)]
MADKPTENPPDDSLRTFLGAELSPSEPRDPMVSARENKARELPKRFYEKVGLEQREDGYALTLDGRLARTPARKLLMVSDKALAEALVAEWAAQGTHIDPGMMPLTRLINVGLDRMPLAMAESRAEIARYAGNDMLLYRADSPERLVERQNMLWNPVLAWAETMLGARFVTGIGIIHVPQDSAALAAVEAHLENHDDPLALTALHVVTTLTGSALLALALAEGAFPANQLWDAAHADEDFQIALWGEDDEALARRAFRRCEYDAAALVLACLFAD